MKQLSVQQITKGGSGVGGIECLSVVVQYLSLWELWVGSLGVYVHVCMHVQTCVPKGVVKTQVEFITFDCVVPDITPNRC